VVDLTELEDIARSNGVKSDPSTSSAIPGESIGTPGSTTTAAEKLAVPATSDDEVLVLSPVLVAKQNRIGSGGQKKGSKKTPGKGARPTSGKSQK
jgi:hypothetical protein